MSFSDGHANQVLDLDSTYTMSLHSGDPGGDGTANEIVGGSYQRESVSTGAASGKQKANTDTTTYADLPAVTVSHAVLWVTTSSKYIAQLATPHDVQAGESLQFGPGDITIALT